jgi:hypothetical protein
MSKYAIGTANPRTSAVKDSAHPTQTSLSKGFSASTGYQFSKSP